MSRARCNLLICASFILLSEASFAGDWVKVPARLRGDGSSLEAVTAVADNDVWATGYSVESGTGYHTLVEHWNGAAWSVFPSPDASTSYNVLQAVAAHASNDVWAVGRQVQPVGQRTALQTLTEHWDGRRWRLIPSPNIAGRGYNSFLTGVTAIEANDVWAVGSSLPENSDGFHGLTLHWDGAAWSIISTPTVQEDILLDVDALASNNVWAVGYTMTTPNSYATLIFHWDGIAWNVIPSPNTPSSYNVLEGISAVAPNDIWAVGHSGLPDSDGQTLALHWDGISWTIVPTGQQSSDNHFASVIALSSTNVWAVGGDAVADQPISQNWTGTTWTTVPLPRARTRATLNSVTATPGGTLWAVGHQGEAIEEGVALIYSKSP